MQDFRVLFLAVLSVGKKMFIKYPNVMNGLFQWYDLFTESDSANKN